MILLAKLRNFSSILSVELLFTIIEKNVKNMSADLESFTKIKKQCCRRVLWDAIWKAIINL